MRLFPLLLAVACAPESDWDLVERPADHLPAPGEGGITLTGPDVVVEGFPAVYEVRADDMRIGDIVELAWSTVQAPGPCPRRALTRGTVCLDIDSPLQRIGGTFARNDPATGDAVATFTLTPQATTIPTAYLQALRTAAYRSATSNVLEVTPSPCFYDGELEDCPADSCKAILDAGDSQGDGTYWIDPGSGPVEVECDMTDDGGGWTKVVNILTTSLHHGDNPAASGVLGNPSQEGKLSDADINTLTTEGVWRFDCGTTENSFVRNGSGTWTSMKTNSESWELDQARDGVYECTANRTGYVFSSFTHPTCTAAHANYVASGGASEGRGCYTSEGGWNQAGALWTR